MTPTPTPAPQPLTDADIEQCIEDWSTRGWGDRIGEVRLIARAVLAKVNGIGSEGGAA